MALGSWLRSIAAPGGNGEQFAKGIKSGQQQQAGGTIGSMAGMGVGGAANTMGRAVAGEAGAMQPQWQHADFAGWAPRSHAGRLVRKIGLNWQQAHGGGPTQFEGMDPSRTLRIAPWTPTSARTRQGMQPGGASFRGPGVPGAPDAPWAHRQAPGARGGHGFAEAPTAPQQGMNIGGHTVSAYAGAQQRFPQQLNTVGSMMGGAASRLRASTYKGFST